MMGLISRLSIRCVVSPHMQTPLRAFELIGSMGDAHRAPGGIFAYIQSEHAKGAIGTMRSHLPNPKCAFTTAGVRPEGFSSSGRNTSAAREARTTAQRRVALNVG